jgi:fatty acid-binding protein DegV
MTNLPLFTDTDSSRLLDLAAKYGIRQVPIGINLDGKTYETGINLDDQLIFQYLESAKQYPTTAAPSPAAFTREFETAIQAGAETIVCICVSSKVSTTYNSAVMAAETFDHDIVVIDSEYLSIGQGFMALSAAESFLSGATAMKLSRALGGDEEQDSHLCRSSFPQVHCLKRSPATSTRKHRRYPGHQAHPDCPKMVRLEVINKQRTMKKAMEKMLELSRRQ